MSRKKKTRNVKDLLPMSRDNARIQAEKTGSKKVSKASKQNLISYELKKAKKKKGLKAGSRHSIAKLSENSQKSLAVDKRIGSKEPVVLGVRNNKHNATLSATESTQTMSKNQRKKALVQANLLVPNASIIMRSKFKDEIFKALNSGRGDAIKKLKNNFSDIENIIDDLMVLQPYEEENRLNELSILDQSVLKIGMEIIAASDLINQSDDELDLDENQLFNSFESANIEQYK